MPAATMPQMPLRREAGGSTATTMRRERRWRSTRSRSMSLAEEQPVGAVLDQFAHQLLAAEPRAGIAADDAVEEAGGEVRCVRRRRRAGDHRVVGGDQPAKQRHRPRRRGHHLARAVAEAEPELQHVPGLLGMAPLARARPPRRRRIAGRGAPPDPPRRTPARARRSAIRAAAASAARPAARRSRGCASSPETPSIITSRTSAKVSPTSAIGPSRCRRRAVGRGPCPHPFGAGAGLARAAAAEEQPDQPVARRLPLVGPRIGAPVAVHEFEFLVARPAEEAKRVLPPPQPIDEFDVPVRPVALHDRRAPVSLPSRRRPFRAPSALRVSWRGWSGCAHPSPRWRRPSCGAGVSIMPIWRSTARSSRADTAPASARVAASFRRAVGSTAGVGGAPSGARPALAVGDARERARRDAEFPGDDPVREDRLGIAPPRLLADNRIGQRGLWRRGHARQVDARPVQLGAIAGLVPGFDQDIRVSSAILPQPQKQKAPAGRRRPDKFAETVTSGEEDGMRAVPARHWWSDPGRVDRSRTCLTLTRHMVTGRHPVKDSVPS